MSDNLTDEQIKNQNIKQMGKKLGEVYTELWQQVTWLNLKWQEYVELYGTKQSRIDLMNKAANSLFYIVEKSMWESILLHITSLTDPPSMGKNRNLSIKQFLELVEDKKLSGRLKKKIDVVDSKVRFARDWRNRLIAHSDFKLAINKTAKPLEVASRKKVKEAIDSICAVMNEVSIELLNSETGYEYVLIAGDAKSLLYVIRDGLKASEIKRKKMESGDYGNTDYQVNEI